MFGLSKKDKKKSKKGAGDGFVPSFGNAEDFMKVYAQGEEHVVLGRHNGANVGLTAVDDPCNNIVIINDNSQSVLEQCIVPTVEQCKLSYVVYDPNGEYHNALAEKMKAKGYDVQLVDLADPTNKSRIDLFEIANITKSPYWTALILSGSIKCAGAEVKVARDLFMAMMQYLLVVNGKITIVDMNNLFVSIVANDEQIMRNMKACPESAKYIEQIENAEPEMRNVVFKKVYERFFKTTAMKIHKPNIFTVTAHKKQTVIFVKRAPEEYKYLITAMLFNLKTSSVVCGQKEVSTLIIDSAKDEWYHRALLEMACHEVGTVVNNGVATMSIRKTVEKSAKSPYRKHRILVYMHSDDLDTRLHVCKHMTVANMLSEAEKEEVSKKFFKRKPIPEDVLDAAPITMEELEKISDCIVIDTSRAVKPFRCARLG